MEWLIGLLRAELGQQESESKGKNKKEEEGEEKEEEEEGRGEGESSSMVRLDTKVACECLSQRLERIIKETKMKEREDRKEKERRQDDV